MLRLEESKENNIFSHPILGCKRHGEKREIGAKIIYEMYWLTCYSSYFIELNDHTVSFEQLQWADIIDGHALK